MYTDEHIGGYVIRMAKENLVFLTIIQLPDGYRKYESITIDEWRKHLALQLKEGE